MSTNAGTTQTGSDASSETHRVLLKELLALLDGGQAHAKLADAVKDFPQALRGTVPAGLPYSAWQLLEHLRLAQEDILLFCAPPEGGYKAKEWPKAYWPEEAEPPSVGAWKGALEAIETDRKRLDEIVKAPGADLYTPFAWGDGQNLLREILLVADHNAYHVAELIVVRRLLGIW